MARNSGIEWTWTRLPDGTYLKGETWNPTRGCFPISPGCAGCYACAYAARFNKPGLAYQGLANFNEHGHAHWTGKITLVDNHLIDPIRHRKPGKVFVDSMSDLWHEGVPYSYIDRVFAAMYLAPHKTFIGLTKRAQRATEWASRPDVELRIIREAEKLLTTHKAVLWHIRPPVWQWPLPNYWHGFSAESNHYLLSRWQYARHFPARVHLVSAEPLLGPLPDLPSVLDSRLRPRVDWLIVGGESEAGGWNARPVALPWVREARDFAVEHEVPLFFKQWGQFLPGEPDGNREEASGEWQMQDGRRLSRVQLANLNHQVHWWPDCRVSVKVAHKSEAGRMLDGRTWEQFPVGGS